MHREDLSRKMVCKMKPVAVILNMYLTGIGIARNLGRHGIPVIGVSSSNDAPGCVSRFAKKMIAPDSERDPDGLADFLMNYGATLKNGGIIFPTRDADVFFLDRYRDELERYFIIPQPRNEMLNLIMNKKHLAETAIDLGVAVPKTVAIDSVEMLEEKKDEIVFPAVVKPVCANQWRRREVWEAVDKRKGIKVEDVSSLREVYGMISRYEKDVLVQEWVPGDEDQFFIVGAYFSRESKCLGSFVAQKLLQFPPDFGLGCLVRTAYDEEVCKLGLKLLEGMEFHGIAEVEFKRDGRTREYKLIEVNPRHWDQHPIGVPLGVNLSLIAYADLCGSFRQGSASDNGTSAREVLWINEFDFFWRLSHDRKQGRGRRGWLKPIVGGRKVVFALFSWRDPFPFLLQGVRCLLTFVKHILAGLTGMIRGEERE